MRTEADIIIQEAEAKLSVLYKQSIKLSINPVEVLNVDEKLNYIALVVCNALSVPINQVFKRNRESHIAEARQFIMYYAKTKHRIGPSRIGGFLSIHHTTAIHGINAIKNLLSANDELTVYNKELIETEFKDHEA